MSSIVTILVIPLAIWLAILSLAGGLIWGERRLLALFQDRYGPNRCGPLGLVQPLADVVKLFFKEDWIPPFADKPVFILAPALIMIAVLMSFAVVPFGPRTLRAVLHLDVDDAALETAVAGLRRALAWPRAGAAGQVAASRTV